MNSIQSALEEEFLPIFQLDMVSLEEVEQWKTEALKDILDMVAKSEQIQN